MAYKKGIDEGIRQGKQCLELREIKKEKTEALYTFWSGKVLCLVWVCKPIWVALLGDLDQPKQGLLSQRASKKNTKKKKTHTHTTTTTTINNYDGWLSV